MSTLHERLAAEIDRRLAVARAAEAFRPSPWTCPAAPFDDRIEDRYGAGVAYDIEGDLPGPFIALHDPADAIRRYEGELEVLERHAHQAPTIANAVDGDGQPHPGICGHCDPGRRHWPCREIRSLAARLGVSVDG